MSDKYVDLLKKKKGGDQEDWRRSGEMKGQRKGAQLLELLSNYLFKSQQQNLLSKDLY